MTKVTLPRLNQTGTNEWSDVESNDVAIREVVNGELDTENLKAAAGITRGQLTAEAKPVTWYTPKIIATEETRENVAYGTLTTADEITGVVVAENALLVVGYIAQFKASVSSGTAAIFLGSNQLKIMGAGGGPFSQAAEGSAATFKGLGTNGFGLFSGSSQPGAAVTTGQILSPATTAAEQAQGGGVVYIFAAAGTYALSIKYKASSGSVTAKERKLWAYTLG